MIQWNPKENIKNILLRASKMLKLILKYKIALINLKPKSWQHHNSKFQYMTQC